MLNVLVDTGKVLAIDPVHLFTQEEWQEMINGPMYSVDRTKALMEALAKKFKQDFSKLAAVLYTGGDGEFKVTLTRVNYKWNDKNMNDDSI